MTDKILVDIFGEHLPYEIDMLRSTYQRLANLPNIGPASETVQHKLCRRNALIESFCVHARALLDFFSNRSTDATDAIASDFTIGYTPNFDPATEPLKTLRTKLNKQLFHLTKDRTTVMAEKFNVSTDGVIVLQKIESAIELFKKCLTSDFQNFRCNTEPLQFISTFPFAGATGAFSTESFTVYPPYEP